MPPFESLSADWTVSNLTDVRLATFEEAIDVTGKLVEMYYNVKHILGFNQNSNNVVKIADLLVAIGLIITIFVWI